MAREIKTSLIVDGEQAFKRSINEANTSMKNLGTQLTLAQAQFKKDGDAMKLMETRSKALKGEIDQQEKIVEALEKAVQDSAKAYGENSEKTEKWQAELNRAKASLVNLQSELTLNDSGLDRNGKAFDESSGKAADYQATLKTIGKNVSFETVTNGINRITTGFENAISLVFKFGKKMKDTMVEAGDWADNLSERATKYDMDVEELQRWDNAADLIDTDVDTIMSARDKLNAKMADGWTQGSGSEKKDMWEFLGIDLRDSKGDMRDQMDIMWEFGETLMNIEKIDGDSVRADQYARDVFGKSWRELKPLFAAGRQEWEKTVAEQRVVSKANVEALAAMDDSFENLENSWNTAKYSVLAEMAPILKEVADALTGLLNEFNDWMKTEEGQEAMKGLSDALKDLFSGLSDIKFADAISIVEDAINALKDGLIWLKDNKDAIVTALKAIGLGFAGLKVSNTVLQFLQMKNGLLGLGGGKAADGIAQAAGGSNLATAASSAGGAGVTLGGLFGSGTTFSMMGGLSTFGPLAVMALGGYAGWSMVNANLRDENLNQIYGYGHLTGEEGSSGGLIDTMTPEQWAAAARYFSIYRDSSKWGTEEAYAARDELFGLLERGGYTNTEQAVGLLENTFDRYLSGDEGNDLVSKILLRHPEVFGGEAWSGTFGQAGALFQGANRDVIAGAIEDAIYNSGAGPVKGRWSNAGDGAEDILTGGDLRMFRGLPGEMQEKVQVGVQRGVSGIRVQLDGADVGRLIAPYVNEYLGRQAQ